MAEKKNKQEKLSEEHFQVEEAFSRLEEIIGRLESDAVPLRESIALYGEGAKLLARCREELSREKAARTFIRKAGNEEPERVVILSPAPEE